MSSKTPASLEVSTGALRLLVCFNLVSYLELMLLFIYSMVAALLTSVANVENNAMLPVLRTSIPGIVHSGSVIVCHRPSTKARKLP
jgi:hypothetical protein